MLRVSEILLRPRRQPRAKKTPVGGHPSQIGLTQNVHFHKQNLASVTCLQAKWGLHIVPYIKMKPQAKQGLRGL